MKLIKEHPLCLSSWLSSTSISKGTLLPHTTNKKAIVYQEQVAINLGRIWFSEVISLTIKSLHRASASIWEAIRPLIGQRNSSKPNFSIFRPAACRGGMVWETDFSGGPVHAEWWQGTGPQEGSPRTGCSSFLGVWAKGGDVGNRSRTQSLTRIPCYFTAWHKRRIFDKTRQNSQGKENSCSFHFSITCRRHRQCRAEVAPPAEGNSVCSGNNKAQL